MHAKDDFPDGGLRAWLVVLGVRSLIFAIGQCAADDYIFSVPVQFSHRGLLYAATLLVSFFRVDSVVFRIGYVNSFGVSEHTSSRVFRYSLWYWVSIAGASRLL